MPAPLTLGPLAWTALRLGAAAAITLYVRRRAETAPHDRRHEDLLDEIGEGADLSSTDTDGAQTLRGRGRLRRVIRLGSNGPALEIDAAALGRVRLRRTR